MYSVVVFTDENSVNVVPKSWLVVSGSEYHCLWPPHAPTTKMIQELVPPESNWKSYACRLMFSHRMWIVNLTTKCELFVSVWFFCIVCFETFLKLGIFVGFAVLHLFPTDLTYFEKCIKNVRYLLKILTFFILGSHFPILYYTIWFNLSNTGWLYPDNSTILNRQLCIKIKLLQTLAHVCCLDDYNLCWKKSKRAEDTSDLETGDSETEKQQSREKR